MGKRSLIDYIKDAIAWLGFRMFLWGNELTQDEYFDQIFEQELAFKNHPERYEES